MTDKEIRQLKKSAAAHIALAAIALLAVVCFFVVWGLVGADVVSESFFQNAFPWLFLIFVPAAALNAVLTLSWMVPIVRWRPKASRATVYRQILLDYLISR